MGPTSLIDKHLVGELWKSMQVGVCGLGVLQTNRGRDVGVMICFLNAHFSAYALSGDAKIR